MPKKFPGGERTCIGEVDLWLPRTCIGEVDLWLPKKFPGGERSIGEVDLWLPKKFAGGERTNDTEAISERATDGVVELGRWSLVVGSIDYQTGALKTHMDGLPVDMGVAQEFGQSSTSDTPARSSAIGAEDDESEDFFDGVIDELRITTSIRNEDWVRAQNQSMRDSQFVSYGPEEAAPAT